MFQSYSGYLEVEHKWRQSDECNGQHWTNCCYNTIKEIHFKEKIIFV